jgi:hypothetical protein
LNAVATCRFSRTDLSLYLNDKARFLCECKNAFLIPATDPPQAVTHRSIIVCCSPGECGGTLGYCGGAHLHEFQSTCSRAWLIRDGSEHPEGAQGLLMRNGACAYAMAVGALVLMRKALVKPGCRTSCTANVGAR